MTLLAYKWPYFIDKPTLIVLAFAHEQREEAGRVLGLLQQASEQNASLGWYEMPIIDAPGIAHYFIKNGMRDGTDEKLHAHIVPQFIDKEEWQNATGITGTEPLLAKVNPEGKILKTTPLSKIKSVKDLMQFGA